MLTTYCYIAWNQKLSFIGVKFIRYALLNTMHIYSTSTLITRVNILWPSIFGSNHLYLVNITTCSKCFDFIFPEKHTSKYWNYNFWLYLNCSATVFEIKTWKNAFYKYRIQYIEVWKIYDVHWTEMISIQSHELSHCSNCQFWNYHLKLTPHSTAWT